MPEGRWCRSCLLPTSGLCIQDACSEPAAQLVTPGMQSDAEGCWLVQAIQAVAAAVTRRD